MSFSLLIWRLVNIYTFDPYRSWNNRASFYEPIICFGLAILTIQPFYDSLEEVVAGRQPFVLKFNVF